MEPTIDRKSQLQTWVATTTGLSSTEWQALPHDASFRRYFRFFSGEHSFIVMDAPPPQENCAPFVAVARALQQLNLNVPDIIAENIAQGFLLLSDLGDTTYLQALTAENADSLYQQALRELAILQTCHTRTKITVPAFTAEWMQQEWSWHKEWFAQKLLHQETLADESALDHCYAAIVQMAANQPQVFMHRDFHSANLMVLPNQQTGILDFQDAFIGPLTYDLVSLLRDCYIDWPLEKVKQWALFYRDILRTRGELIAVTDEVFLRWFDWMGVQRHLKALLTFARKYVRDQQATYLKYVPRTLNYLRAVTKQYPELLPMHDYIKHSQALFLQGHASCAA